MNELIKKLQDDGNIEALHSLEAFKSKAEELGFNAEEVAAALEEFGEFPLSDEDLQQAVGGVKPLHGYDGEISEINFNKKNNVTL